jgi:hypothetical protein
VAAEKAITGLTQRVATIPPTQLVVRSYSAYKQEGSAFPKSHQRSWWIVHTQPNFLLGFALRLIRVRSGMNHPPTPLVGFEAPAQCPA